MARPAYMMLCQSLSVEAVTNRISFFHAVEGIEFTHAVSGEPIPDHATQVLAPQLAVAWIKEEGDNPDVVFECEIICLSPSGQPIFATPLQTFSFLQNVNFHRFMVTARVGDLSETGIYWIEGRLRTAGQADWTHRQTYPFHVREAVPTPAPSG